MGARTTALSALIACRKQGAWADGVLKEYIRRDNLDRRDAALASRLCYGVIQNRMLLDYYIQSCLNGSLKKLQPIVLDILRLGVYQLLLMDRVPDSAAVNEAVEQGKKYANRSAAGLINAVLRRIVREGSTLPRPESLSIQFSHPEELVQLLRRNVPVHLLQPLLESNNQAPETVIHLNPLLANETDFDQLKAIESADLIAHPWLTDAFLMTGVGNIESLPAYKNGTIMVQDGAARLSVVAADPRPGMNVIDVCSSPGGKSFAAAFMMKNTGSIVSCDIHPHKINLIGQGAKRLGIHIIDPVLHDATVNNPQWNEKMDVVIADVPCSGLGVIRKKPDIRYKDLRQSEQLPSIQRKIIENASCYVKPGGVLLYSTCTILRRENEEIVDAFLEKHPDFHLEAFPLPDGFPEKGNNGMVTLLPCVHGTDGFFICKLRRDS